MDESTSTFPLTSVSSHLPEPVELFGEVWCDIYPKIWTLLGIALPTSFIGFVIGLIVSSWKTLLVHSEGAFFVSSTTSGMMIVALLVLCITSVIIQIWSYIAMMIALRAEGKISVWRAYGKSTHLFFSIAWVSILQTILIIGGITLLVAPGVLLIAHILFADFVVINEGKKGMAALMISAEYVYGRFWAVLWRVLVPIVGYLILTGIILRFFLILGVSPYFDLASPILGFFFAPFFFAYLYKLYEKLRLTNERAITMPRRYRSYVLLVFGIGTAILVLLASMYIVGIVYGLSA